MTWLCESEANRHWQLIPLPLGIVWLVGAYTCDERGRRRSLDWEDPKMTMGVRSMIQHKNDRPRSPQSKTDGKETRNDQFCNRRCALANKVRQRSSECKSSSHAVTDWQLGVVGCWVCALHTHEIQDGPAPAPCAMPKKKNRIDFSSSRFASNDVSFLLFGLGPFFAGSEEKTREQYM